MPSVRIVFFCFPNQIPEVCKLPSPFIRFLELPFITWKVFEGKYSLAFSQKNLFFKISYTTGSQIGFLRMETAENSSWDLTQKRKIFGLESRREGEGSTAKFLTMIFFAVLLVALVDMSL
jgi:hypothetical protein